jgi:hypothetical protein
MMCLHLTGDGGVDPGVIHLPDLHSQVSCPTTPPGYLLLAPKMRGSGPLTDLLGPGHCRPIH